MSTPSDDAVNEFKTLYDLSNSAKNDVLLFSLQSAYDAFEKYTDCLIDETTISETFQGDGGRCYIPSRLPIVSITSLTIDDIAIDEATSYDENGYYTDGNLLKLRGYSFSGWVVLTYKAGNVLENNNALQHSVYEYAYLVLQSNKRAGVKSQTIGDKTISYTDDILTPNIKRNWDSIRVLAK